MTAQYIGGWMARCTMTDDDDDDKYDDDKGGSSLRSLVRGGYSAAHLSLLRLPPPALPWSSSAANSLPPPIISTYRQDDWRGCEAGSASAAVQKLRVQRLCGMHRRGGPSSHQQSLAVPAGASRRSLAHHAARTSFDHTNLSDYSVGEVPVALPGSVVALPLRLELSPSPTITSLARWPCLHPPTSRLPMVFSTQHLCATTCTLSNTHTKKPSKTLRRF